MKSYTIRKMQTGYAVFDGNTRVSQAFVSRGEAEDPACQMLQRDTAKTRNCLCCGHPFLSEGAHHRMCSLCRTRSASDDWMSRVIE